MLAQTRNRKKMETSHALVMCSASQWSASGKRRWGTTTFHINRTTNDHGEIVSLRSERALSRSRHRHRRRHQPGAQKNTRRRRTIISRQEEVDSSSSSSSSRFEFQSSFKVTDARFLIRSSLAMASRVKMECNRSKCHAGE